MTDSKKVIALLNDLMFTVKIQEAAKRAGLEITFVKSRDKGMELAEANALAMILDLNYAAADPLELISALKGNEKTKAVSLLGYVAHVQVELRQEAQARGCDVVVARSAFVQNLPELLERISQKNGKRAG